jgi:hypothetical protein
MASQPANAAIKVHRRVRSYRQMIRHNNIKAMCNRMRPLIMSVPGRETQILSTFDGDANIVQTNQTSNRRGLPIVRYIRPVVPFGTAAENIAGLNFPVTIGQDKFLEKADASVRDDLHQDLRDELGASDIYR